jgi:hypothetical protein
MRQTGHRRERHHRHPRHLFVFLLAAGSDCWLEMKGCTVQIFSNDPKGLNLALVESAKGVQIPLSKGPFTLAVQDPANTVTVTRTGQDEVVPSNFKPNGTGNVGTVTIVVTDTSVTPPLVAAPVSFDVVAPVPPVQVPDSLVASLVPAP